VEFDGRDLLALPEAAMRGVRGHHIGMVFQEPMSALNPVMTNGAQIAEAIRLHRGGGRRAGRAEALALLRLVEIPDAEPLSLAN
jgi:ABC-type microcin C transport system duplicated ATPase subunit YejF